MDDSEGGCSAKAFPEPISVDVDDFADWEEQNAALANRTRSFVV
jgi:hypothetical protein